VGGSSPRSTAESAMRVAVGASPVRQCPFRGSARPGRWLGESADCDAVHGAANSTPTVPNRSRHSGTIRSPNAKRSHRSQTFPKPRERFPSRETAGFAIRSRSLFCLGTIIPTVPVPPPFRRGTDGNVSRGTNQAGFHGCQPPRLVDVGIHMILNAASRPSQATSTVL
jgi:hypothetical protein